MHDLNFIYKCNPEKNKECKKTECQKSCFWTTHAEYSADNKKYYNVQSHIEEWKGDTNVKN